MTERKSYPQRGNRYSMTLVTRARELREAGWLYVEICRVLKDEFGATVSPGAVRLWADPAAAERSRVNHRTFVRKRAAASTGRFTTLRAATPEFKLARAAGLRDQGLSYAAVTKVMNFDFAEGLTEHQWRHAIELQRVPREYRKVAAA